MKTFEKIQKRISLVVTLVMAVVNEKCAKISNRMSFWGLDMALAGNNFVEKAIGEPHDKEGIGKSLTRRFRFIGWAMRFARRFEGNHTKYDFYHKLAIELAEQRLYGLSRLAAKRTALPETRHRTYLEIFRRRRDLRDLASLRQSIAEIGRDMDGQFYLGQANVYERSEAYFETFLISHDIKDLEAARMEALRQKSIQCKVWSLARIFTVSGDEGDLETARASYSGEGGAFERSSAAIGLYTVTRDRRDIDFARLEAGKVDFWVSKISALADVAVFGRSRDDLWAVKAFCASIAGPRENRAAKEFLKFHRRCKSTEHHRLLDLRARVDVSHPPQKS